MTRDDIERAAQRLADAWRRVETVDLPSERVVGRLIGRDRDRWVAATKTRMPRLPGDREPRLDRARDLQQRRDGSRRR